jgi:hypothetical protein
MYYYLYFLQLNLFIILPVLINKKIPDELVSLYIEISE